MVNSIAENRGVSFCVTQSDSVANLQSSVYPLHRQCNVSASAYVMCSDAMHPSPSLTDLSCLTGQSLFCHPAKPHCYSPSLRSIGEDL